VIQKRTPPGEKSCLRVHEKIVERIGQMIAAGEFRTGDRLPPERRLAETFGASRHAVREAIRALEEKGAVRSQVGDGTYVLARDGQARIEPMVRCIGDGVKLREVFEFRRLLEPQIAALAATAAGVVELEELSRLLAEQRSASGAAAGAAADDAFHLQIARTTGNAVILQVYEQLRATLGESRHESLQSETRRLASLAAHKRILAALRRHDSQRAGQEMRQHLDEIERTVFGR
jgi:GntR family transcriptional regulator, transcriptional repressor for pyruvate dehydrogenase complex